MKSRCARD